MVGLDYGGRINLINITSILFIVLGLGVVAFGVVYYRAAYKDLERVKQGDEDLIKIKTLDQFKSKGDKVAINVRQEDLKRHGYDKFFTREERSNLRSTLFR